MAHINLPYILLGTVLMHEWELLKLLQFDPHGYRTKRQTFFFTKLIYIYVYVQKTHLLLLLVFCFMKYKFNCLFK